MTTRRQDGTIIFEDGTIFYKHRLGASTWIGHNHFAYFIDNQGNFIRENGPGYMDDYDLRYNCTDKPKAIHINLQSVEFYLGYNFIKKYNLNIS